METTPKASARASAGSQDGQLAHKTFVPHRAVPSEEITGSQKKGTTSSFRKFREALMAKKFEDCDNMPVEVDAVSGLFIGSYGAACNFQALQGAGITHILCVSPSLSLKFLEDFTYLQLQVADLSSVNISEFFDEALGFIDRHEDTKVLDL